MKTDKILWLLVVLVLVVATAVSVVWTLSTLPQKSKAFILDNTFKECANLNGSCMELETCDQTLDMGAHGCPPSQTCCRVPRTCDSIGGVCRGMFQCWISGGTQNGIMDCSGSQICCT